MGRKGRPRKNAPRVNGRLKQVQDKTIVPQAQIDMRVRAGIPRDKARTCGTLEDALYESKLIDFDQLHAARHYIILRSKAFIADDNPHVPRDPRKPTGNGPDAYIEFCKGTSERYNAINEYVKAYQREKRFVHLNCIDALQGLASPFGQHVKMDNLEDLQVALDAVHEYLHPRKKSAA